MTIIAANAAPPLLHHQASCRSTVVGVQLIPPKHRSLPDRRDEPGADRWTQPRRRSRCDRHAAARPHDYVRHGTDPCAAGGHRAARSPGVQARRPVHQVPCLTHTGGAPRPPPGTELHLRWTMTPPTSTRRPRPARPGTRVLTFISDLRRRTHCWTHPLPSVPVGKGARPDPDESQSSKTSHSRPGV